MKLIAKVLFFSDITKISNKIFFVESKILMFFGIIVHFFGISMFLAILFLYYSNNSASIAI